MTATLSKARWPLLVLIAMASAAFVVRSGAALPYADEQLYWQLAGTIAEGRGYIQAEGVPSTARPPGYPVVLAPCRLVSDNPIPAKALNIAFLLGASAMVAGLARGFSGSKAAGPIALLLILLFPIVHYTSGTLYPQIFGSMLFVLVVHLLVRHPERRWASAVSGLAFGALLLAIPAFLLVAPILLIYMLWPKAGASWRSGIGGRFLGVVLFGTATTLVMSPWIARNAVVFGKFIPLSTNSGLMLIQGYSEDASPNSGPTTDLSKYEAEARARGLDAIETDAYFRHEAVDWIRANPGPALRLYLLKTLNYFNFWNELATESEVSRSKQIVSFVTYYPLLALGLIRLLFVRRYPIGRGEALALILYFSSAPLNAIFYPRLRYRIPFDFLLIAVAASFLASWIDSRGRSTRPSPSGTPA